MKKIRKGLAAAIISVVTGVILSAVVAALAQHEVIPSYSPLVFGIVRFIVNIFLIRSFQKAGILYTLGWLGGTWLLRDAMGEIDLIFNIAGPILVLIIRAWLTIRSLGKKHK
jgi:hypothetical protein